MTISLPAINYTTSIPDSGRGKGRAGGENVYQKYMQDMPAPGPALDSKGKPVKGSPTQFAWFFVPAEVPETVTDPAERDKAAKDGCRKLVNRFTSVSRRIRKANSETHDYTFRQARDPNAPEGTQGNWGIIVYRIEPGSDKGGPPKKGQAAAA